MDPYKVLDVTQTASQDEIKSAYRKLAKKLHPDLNPGNKDRENKFKELSEAYELIETPEKRAKYDRGETSPDQGSTRTNQSGQGPFYYQTQNPGSRYSQNFENIDPSFFEDLFARGFDRQGTTHQRPPEDQHFSMEIDFNTSILGGEKEINLPSGKKLRVKIPPGIKSGSKLRLTGQSEVSGPGIPSGDVYIEVNVSPSLIFKRIENDLEIDLPLSINEAILGGEVRIPTVDGFIMLNVPRGVTTGSRIRIKGKGVPFTEGRGDLFAAVKIAMPPKVDPELENFMKDWSKAHPYNPREGQGK